MNSKTITKVALLPYIQDDPNRTYAKGRPIAPYKHGEEITGISEVSTGDVLIVLCHKVEAENLIKVVDRDRNPKGFDFHYMTPEGECFGAHGNDLMFMWDFMLSCEQVTVYRAERTPVTVA